MKDVIFFKTITPIEIGGAESDRWSRKMPDNWMAKTTVREDEEGNLWLVWSGGGKAHTGEHKIPKANIAQVSYAMAEDRGADIPPGWSVVDGKAVPPPSDKEKSEAKATTGGKR